MILRKVPLIPLFLLGATVAVLAADHKAHKHGKQALAKGHSKDEPQKLWHHHDDDDDHHHHHHKRCPAKCRTVVTETATVTKVLTVKVAGPVTITDTLNGETVTRTVTNGDMTSVDKSCPSSPPDPSNSACPSCPTNNPCPTCSACPTCPTNGPEPSNSPCPSCPTCSICPTCSACPTMSAASVVITETVGDVTYTRTVTEGDNTSLPCPVNTATCATMSCPSCPSPTPESCVVTEVINGETISFTFSGTTTTTIDFAQSPCPPQPPCPTDEPITTSTSSSSSTDSVEPTPMPSCLCTEAGTFCGKEWPSECELVNYVVYMCDGEGAMPVQNETCGTTRCVQEGNEAHCMIDCEVILQAGIYGGPDDGSIRGINVMLPALYTKLYDTRNSGTTWAIAVNRFETEMKSSENQVYRGTKDDYWSAVPELDQPRNEEVDAYGARQDGEFFFASSHQAGKVHYHPDPPVGEAETAEFTNLEGNSRQFCGSSNACILDIAFDGYDHAWIVDREGHLFISTLPQRTTKGGPVKHIGKISLFPGEYSWGIAFDGLGHVYYAGGVDRGENGWVVQANMTSPLEVTMFFEDPNRDFGDLASCAHPKADLSGVLGAEYFPSR